MDCCPGKGKQASKELTYLKAYSKEDLSGREV